MAYRISDVEGGVEVIIVAAGQVALCIETRQLGTSTDNCMETQVQHIEQGHCRSIVSECYMYQDCLTLKNQICENIFLENCQAETRELLVQVNNIGKCYYPLSIILREQNFNQELQCLQCVSQ